MKIQLPEKVNKIIGALTAGGYEAYAVGGCVRDSILGRTPDDWDITTSAPPSVVKRIFPHTADTGLQHGTVTVIIDKEGFEVTTYRIDGVYEDGRHPKEVTFTHNLTQDLQRRDFTINAMAYNEQSGIVDVFGGAEDLKNGQIRCVGQPTQRFTEDALRVLRAVRFAAQLGFDIEEKTKDAMRQMAVNLKQISAERIQTELVKLLVSPNPSMLRLAYETGITNIILPEFDAMMKVEQHNPHHIYTVGEHTLHALEEISAQKPLRLAILFHDIGKPATEEIDEEGVSHFYQHALKSEEIAHIIMRRLKFDNETLHRVKRLVRWHDYRFTLEEASMRRSIHKIGADLIEELLSVMEADVLAQSKYMQKEKLLELEAIHQLYQEIIEKKQCLSLKELAINGKTLMELGVRSGPQMGKLLSQLLETVIENPEKNERDYLIEEAKKKMDNQIITREQ